MALGGLGFNAVQVGIGTDVPLATLQVVGNIRVGTSGTNGCLQNFAGTALAGTCSSDERLKANIMEFPMVLNKLAQLQPVHFNWKVSEHPEYHFGAALNSGLIAQQVEKFFPDLVSVDERGFKQVNYTELPFLMLQGIRELKTENDNLAGQVRDAHTELARLNRVSAEKDEQIVSLNRRVEELRKAQEQTAILVARLAQQQSGQSHVARAHSSKHAPAKTGKPARTQIARAQF
jgi:hypothetical protein